MPAAGQLAENSPARVVFAGASEGAMFVDTVGDPIPPAELQQVIREAGEKFGLSLKVEWLNAAWGMSAFVVKQQWPQGDKKWQRVQCGECAPENAFDVIFRFPREMRTGDMVGHVRDKFGFVRDPKAEAQRLMEQAERLLRQSTEGAIDAAVETGTQRILDESDHTRLVRAGLERAHPMVSGADLVDRKPKSLFDAPTVAAQEPAA